MKRKLLALAFLLGFTSYGLSWYWFDWRLAIILFIAQWAQNIENKYRL